MIWLVKNIEHTDPNSKLRISNFDSYITFLDNAKTVNEEKARQFIFISERNFFAVVIPNTFRASLILCFRMLTCTTLFWVIPYLVFFPHSFSISLYIVQFLFIDNMLHSALAIYQRSTNIQVYCICWNGTDKILIAWFL